VEISTGRLQYQQTLTKRLRELCANVSDALGDVRASRVNNVDLGLRKNVKVSERVRVQLRGDAFNSFIPPRFPGPDANPSDAAFGTVFEDAELSAKRAGVRAAGELRGGGAGLKPGAG
jgi:hypothetical protein